MFDIRNRWVNGCRVTATDWIDGENIYVNVEYFSQGSSLSRPPLWEKIVYVKKDDNGINMITNFLDSFVGWVCRINIPEGCKMCISVGDNDIYRRLAR